jgi:hypothetical protein
MVRTPVGVVHEAVAELSSEESAGEREVDHLSSGASIPERSTEFVVGFRGHSALGLCCTDGEERDEAVFATGIHPVVREKRGAGAGGSEPGAAG